jgi:hypothetical protein
VRIWQPEETLEALIAAVWEISHSRLPAIGIVAKMPLTNLDKKKKKKKRKKGREPQ